MMEIVRDALEKKAQKGSMYGMREWKEWETRKWPTYGPRQSDATSVASNGNMNGRPWFIHLKMDGPGIRIFFLF